MEPEQPKQDQKNFIKRFFSFKILLLIVLVVGAIEGYFLIKSYSASKIPPPPKVEGLKGGEIVLLSSKDNIKINEGMRVTIKISTGGHPTRGSDVILKFDPKHLEGIQTSLHKSKMYPEYPQFSLDNKNGLVKISGISPVANKTFKGVGILAFLDFKAKQSGNTQVSIEFVKNRTDDSNIIEAGTSNDILEKVNQLNINIIP